MRQSRTLLYTATAAALLTVGTIGLSATPTCQRIIKVYREKVVRHHVTQATANRWAVWAKTHPNYRPKKRPAMSPEESLKKVALACDIPGANQLFGDLLPPAQQSNLLMPEETPVFLASVTPAFTLVGTPITSNPIAPTDDLPTPEPAPFVLLGSALALLICWKRQRFFGPFSGKTPSAV